MSATVTRSAGGVFNRSAGGVRGVGAPSGVTRYEADASIVYDGKMWILGRYVSTGGGYGYEAGVWNSEDGETWTEITDDAGWLYYNNNLLNVFVSDGKMWCTTIGPYPFIHYNYSSVDGETWTLESEYSGGQISNGVIGNTFISQTINAHLLWSGFADENGWYDISNINYSSDLSVWSRNEDAWSEYIGRYKDYKIQQLAACTHGNLGHLWYLPTIAEGGFRLLRCLKSNAALTEYTKDFETSCPSSSLDRPFIGISYDGALWTFTHRGVYVDYVLQSSNINNTQHLLNYDGYIWSVYGNTVRKTNDGTFTVVNPSIW